MGIRQGIMTREMHDGRQDGLEPLESLNVRGTKGFAEMLRAMSKTAFGARQLGEAFEVSQSMINDSHCLVILTISGAITVAKMGRVICEMISTGMVDIIVSTGAIMAHGLSDDIGLTHYKRDPSKSDLELFRLGYNRVYDTLEMEANLNYVQRVVGKVMHEIEWSEPIGSVEINRAIGQHLSEHGHMPSVLGCAYESEVPVYVPAFTDSEMGLDIATFKLKRDGAAGKQDDLDNLFSATPLFNPYNDLYDYAKRALRAKRLGIFTIGGGVPRNWAQQVGPFIDITNVRLGTELPAPRIQYGVRICPEPAHWGGLSGCTYSEGVSWGKFLSREEGGRFAEVYCDATIAWPLLVRALIEETEAQS